MRKINNKGFTLLELVAAMVIIGILVVVVTPDYISRVDRARDVDELTKTYLVQQSVTDKIYSQQHTGGIFYQGDLTDEAKKRLLNPEDSSDPNGKLGEYRGYKIVSSDGIIAGPKIKLTATNDPYDMLFGNRVKGDPGYRGRIRIIRDDYLEKIEKALGEKEGYLTKNEKTGEDTFYVVDGYYKVYQLISDNTKVEVENKNQLVPDDTEGSISDSGVGVDLSMYQKPYNTTTINPTSIPGTGGTSTAQPTP